MATFADLSTLMLTFFVLMLSMATIDIMKFREMLGSVKEAFGVQFKEFGAHSQSGPAIEVTPTEKSGESKIEAPYQYTGSDMELEEMEDELKRANAEERDKAVEEIKEAIEESKMADMVEVQSGPNGIRVRVKGALLFDAGAADVRAQAQPFLDTLFQVLGKFGYYLLVEGHTDSTPISTARFPSNWELSGDRASAVLRYLISKGVSPMRLTSVGLADNYPLTGNDTAEGRAKNRRVEFVLTKQAFRPEIN